MLSTVTRSIPVRNPGVNCPRARKARLRLGTGIWKSIVGFCRNSSPAVLIHLCSGVVSIADDSGVWAKDGAGSAGALIASAFGAGSTADVAAVSGIAEAGGVAGVAGSGCV